MNEIQEALSNLDDVEREMNCLKYSQFEDRGDTFDDSDSDDFTRSGDLYFDDYMEDDKKKEKKEEKPKAEFDHNMLENLNMSDSEMEEGELSNLTDKSSSS